MGVFWSPAEEPGAEPSAESGTSTTRCGGPSSWCAPTVLLVVCSLAIAVAAGPIYAFSERTAADLLDPAALHRRGAGR